MTPQVPVRRTVGAVISVVVVTASLFTAVFLLPSGADAAPRSSHSAAYSSGDPLLARLLQRLSAAQGIHRFGRNPIRPPSSTSAPTSSAPTSSVPTSSAPTSSAPTSSAPTTPAPTSSDPTSAAPTSASSAPSSSPTSADPADPADPTVAGDSLVMSDEFDGAAGSPADPSAWSYRPGGDWGNGEIECYTKSARNAGLDGNGDLVLTARYAPGTYCPGGRTTTTNDYTSARLDSKGLAAAQYGKIRVRAKVPSAQGVWPAIWLLGDDIDNVGWPACGEIDMMEAIGENRTTVYGTVHGPNASGGQWATGAPGGVTLSSPMDTNFHVYGLDWTPTSMTLSVDGNSYLTVSKRQVLAAGNRWVFDHPFFLLLNVAVGGDWPGNPKDNGVFPRSMTVDYIRVYH